MSSNNNMEKDNNNKIESKVNKNFLNFVNSRKNRNIEIEHDDIENYKFKPKVKKMNGDIDKTKIELNKLIPSNENNKNDGSLKDLLGKNFGKTIIKGTYIPKEENGEGEGEEDEEESDEEDDDYEQEKYNHFIRSGKDLYEEFEEEDEELDEEPEDYEEDEEELEEEDDHSKNQQKNKNSKKLHNDNANNKINDKKFPIAESNTNSKARTNTEVFIENLPTNRNEKQVTKFLNSLYPNIIKVKVLKDKEGNMRDKAFIKFATLDEANAFIKQQEKEKTIFANKLLTFKIIEGSNSQKQKPDNNSMKQKTNKTNLNHTAFIGNLPITVDENKLKSIFKQTSNIRIQKGADNKSKGFCYIDFNSEDALNKAVLNNNMEIEGKTIRIEKAKSSFNDLVFEDSKLRLGKKKQRILENKNKNNY